MLPSLAADAQSRSGSPIADADSRYRLRAGDSFELTFPYASTFNQTLTVQPDGYVNLRLVGDVQVAGLTVPELAGTVGVRYASTLRDPTPTIVLRDFEKPYFIAAGEVEKPGKYDLRSDTTLTQAVAIAGGFKDSARKSHVVVIHRALDPKDAVIHEVDTRKMLEGRGEVVQLQPGDVVFVSRRRLPSMTTFATLALPNLGWLAYVIAARP